MIRTSLSTRGPKQQLHVQPSAGAACYVPSAPADNLSPRPNHHQDAHVEEHTQPTSRDHNTRGPPHPTSKTHVVAPPPTDDRPPPTNRLSTTTASGGPTTEQGINAAQCPLHCCQLIQPTHPPLTPRPPQAALHTHSSSLFSSHCCTASSHSVHLAGTAHILSAPEAELLQTYSTPQPRVGPATAEHHRAIQQHWQPPASQQQ
jgi:hypothetical protein